MQHSNPGITPTPSSHIKFRVQAKLSAVLNTSCNVYDLMWCILELFIPGFDPTIPIAQPQWLRDDNILDISQKHHLYFQLQVKKNMFFSSHDQTNIFLRAIAPSEYADVVTTIQTTIDAYRHPDDDGLLPEHLCLDGIAMMIHTDANFWVQDISVPCIHQISGYDSPWDSVDSVELAHCHIQGYCPWVFCAKRLLEDCAECSLSAGCGSGQLHLVVLDTPATIAAPSTLLMAASHIWPNAGAHSNQGYNTMHANVLDMRPPVATCLPSCCAFIDTLPTSEVALCLLLP
jgi:hypothetical protein